MSVLATLFEALATLFGFRQPARGHKKRQRTSSDGRSTDCDGSGGTRGGGRANVARSGDLRLAQ